MDDNQDRVRCCPFSETRLPFLLKIMKKVTLCLLLPAIAFAGASFSFGRKETNSSVGLVVTSDPRPPIYRTFSLGKESKQNLHEMTLIIAWSPT